MKYCGKIEKASFLERKNRFIASVSFGSEILTVHVKNTGRCRELFAPDAVVYLERAEALGRKTPYDLIAVEKKTKDGIILINIDSGAPNKAVGEWLAGGLFSKEALVRAEVKYGNSRFDFYVEDGERRAFVEVKGVTLECEGTVSFPDAPTERGVKHVKELCAAKAAGYEAYVIFVVQMKGALRFTPNRKTHPEFADALKSAAEHGVNILAFDCEVSEDGMVISEEIKEIVI